MRALSRAARFISLIVLGVATMTLPLMATGVIELIGADEQVVFSGRRLLQQPIIFSSSPLHELVYEDIPFQTDVTITNPNNGTIVLAPGSAAVTGLDLLDLVSTFHCPPTPAHTCTVTLTGTFTSSGTSTGVLTISPINGPPSSVPITFTVVSPITAPSSLTFPPQSSGTTGSQQDIPIGNVTPHDLTVTYTFDGANLFSRAGDGSSSGSLSIPAGGSAIVPVAFDTLGVGAPGNYSGSVSFLVNERRITSTGLSGSIFSRCSPAGIVGHSYAGTFQGQMNGSAVVPLSGLVQINVNDFFGSASMSAVLDSPTTTATATLASGTMLVEPDCRFTFDGPFKMKGFLSLDNKFMTGISAFDGTDPFFNGLGNLPGSGTLTATQQDRHLLVRAGSGRYNAHIQSKIFFGSSAQPGVFEAQGNIGSSPVTLFYNFNYGGYQGFNTGVAAMGPYDDSGAGAGSFTKGANSSLPLPFGAAQSLLANALQITQTGEIAVVANEPGSSSDVLASGVLSAAAASPATDRYILDFDARSTSLNLRPFASFRGEFSYTAPSVGTFTGAWLSFDPVTNVVSVTPLTAPVAAGSLAGSFTLNLSNAPTLPGQYQCQTNANSTVRCFNLGSGPTTTPAPFVISVVGSPQAAGPYSVSAVAGSYVVGGRFSQEQLSSVLVRLHTDQFTLEPDGSVTGHEYVLGSTFELVDITGSWTVDSETGAMTVTVMAPGVATANYNGFFNPGGDTNLSCQEPNFEITQITLHPSR